MLCIYRVQSGNGNHDEHAAAAADRFADGGRAAAAGLEEGEALIDNAVSGLDDPWEAIVYRAEEKNLAKFIDTCSTRADRLRIGSPRLAGGKKAIFCTTR